MTIYQWVTLGLGALGFIGTWILMAFKLGQAVEQMKAGVREQIEEEREKIITKIDELERQFSEEQKIQDNRFGEVGAAMREKISQVEQHFRTFELYSERTYAQKGELEKATDRIEAAIKDMVNDLKDDFRDRIDDLRKSFEAKH